MGDTVDAAVDRAVSDLAGSGNPPSAEPTSATAPSPLRSTSTATPAAEPATGAGSAPASVSPTTTTAAAGAITQGDDDGELLSQKDWLDVEKRRAILKGARTKERTTILRDLGLRSDVPLEQLRPHLSLMLSDIGEYHRQLTDTLQRRGLIQQPHEAPSAQPQAPPAPPPQQRRELPEPDLVFADGRRAFSAEAAAELADWVAEGLRQEFNQALEDRLNPLQETHTAVRAAQIRMQAHDHASQVIGEASQWAHFGEFREQIADMMDADKRVTVFSAYNRLLQEKLKTEPARLKEQARQETLREIRTSRTGSPSIVPGQAPVAASRKSGGSLDDVFSDAVSRAFATVPS